MRNRTLTLAITIALLSISAGAFAATNLPVPRQYVADYAKVIDMQNKHILNGLLQELEQKTGAQFIVLTVQTTEGLPIEQYAIELAERWKLGQKGKDNGLLMVVAITDKKYRIEVGYGLEGFITDQYAGRLGREFLVPYFRQGQYGKGTYEVAVRLAGKIAAEAGVQLTGMPKIAPPPTQRRRVSPCGNVLFMLLLIPMMFTRTGRMMLFFMLLSGGRGGARWGGGGGMGGGFGSFGGGMGGGFGGGGAGGSW